MAEFNSHIITNAGRNLLARALAGEGKVVFTKAAFGDQKHSGNLREVTELKNKKLDLNVMNIRNDNGTAVLTVQISNQNVDQSFQTEEFGVYAKIENDVSEVLYSYTTAISADTFPNNRLGKTYESIQDIYMAISSDVEAEIYVRDGVIYLTRDIANQVYTETGITAVGTLKGRSNLEENKQYLADNGHWYKNIGGNRSWNSLGTPDEQLIPITWEYLYKSLNTKEGQLIQNLNGLLGKNNGQFPVDQAVEGNVYYFPANQKYYYCLKSQSGRTSVPNADFEEMSIWANKKKLENLNRNYAIIWEGISHDVQFYVTTNSRYNLTFDNIHSLTIIGNTTCTIPGILLKKLPINKELVIGHDNGVRSDAVFYFKKLSNTFGIFGTRGFAEDIHLHGYNTLIVEY